MPVTLHKTRPPTDKFFFTRTLEINKAYLACLVSTQALGMKGIQFIEHKQPVGYYYGLLSCLGISRPVKDRFIDDHPTCAVAEDEHQFQDDEGMPDDPAEQSGAQGGHYQDLSSRRHFGPFVFNVVKTKAGAARSSWSGQCIAHFTMMLGVRRGHVAEGHGVLALMTESKCSFACATGVSWAGIASLEPRLALLRTRVFLGMLVLLLTRSDLSNNFKMPCHSRLGFYQQQVQQEMTPARMDLRFDGSIVQVAHAQHQ